MEVKAHPQPTLLGYATVRRTGATAFPQQVLEQSGEPLAWFGRWGWFRIYFGPGQRVELADGTRWRLGAANRRSAICPAMRDTDGAFLAIGEPISSDRIGIATRDAALTMYAAERSTWRSRPLVGRPNAWNEDIGQLTRRPHTIITERPLSLAAVLVAFAAAELGVPGATDLGVPRFYWRG